MEKLIFSIVRIFIFPNPLKIEIVKLKIVEKNAVRIIPIKISHGMELELKSNKLILFFNIKNKSTEIIEKKVMYNKAFNIIIDICCLSSFFSAIIFTTPLFIPPDIVVFNITNKLVKLPNWVIPAGPK